MKKNAFILFLATFIISTPTLKAQIHLYVGEGFGMYKFHQGPLETRAFEFNNYTDVTKEMNPNRTYRGLNLGANANLGHFLVGIDWSRKKNSFTGKRAGSGYEIVDSYKELFNSVYINFGIGNEANSGDKLIWRVQTAFGFNNFKLKEETSGYITNFNGIVGKSGGISCRTGIYFCYPIYKKWSINILPFYEFDTTGGYIEILEKSIQNSEFFNINNFGLNLNLDYAF